MNGLTEEEHHLALADRHIEEAGKRTDAAADRLRTSRSTGPDVSAVEKLLGVTLQILETFQSHRQLALGDIDWQRSLLRGLRGPAPLRRTKRR
jgi:hypothetical protein